MDLLQFQQEAVSGYTIQWEDGIPQMGESFDQGGTGWHYGYDSFPRAAYMWNDDPGSPYYLWYLSYETPMTLQDKLELVNEFGAAGILFWEHCQDTDDSSMVRQASDFLRK